VSGDRDPVGDLGVGVRKVYDMYLREGFDNVTMKLYSGDRHEILNELDRALVYEDICSWLYRQASIK
jgi:alpha-beta hydrolase superfamily lysophospholipase